jgi:hypothetical protein
MRLFIAFAVLLMLASSCQRELDIDVQQRPTGDSTAHITPMFRIVEIDDGFPGDSIVSVVTRIEQNGVKTVIMAQTYSWTPGDTLFNVFSYDAQGRLLTIKNGPSRNMATYDVRYQFTWNAGRLIKVVGDTLGAFAESMDLVYTSNGANSVVTSTRIPTYDLIQPDIIYTTKHTVTLNNQFLPVSEQIIHYTRFSTGNFDPSLPQMSHDTTTGYFNFSGNDLMSIDQYFASSDTNVTSFSYTNYTDDTIIHSYARAAGGSNFADSLIQIYGPEVYTLLNFDLIYFYYGASLPSDNSKFFYRRPLSLLTVSARQWVNGIFDPTGSNSNVLYNKMDNTFDASGRLIKALVYYDGSDSDIAITCKFYYY